MLYVFVLSFRFPRVSDSIEYLSFLLVLKSSLVAQMVKHLPTMRAPLSGPHLTLISHSVMSNSLQSHGLQPSRLLCPWDFTGKNTGVGCHSLLQRIFSTQGSNPDLKADSLPSVPGIEPNNQLLPPESPISKYTASQGFNI